MHARLAFGRIDAVWGHAAFGGCRLALSHNSNSGPWSSESLTFYSLRCTGLTGLLTPDYVFTNQMYFAALSTDFTFFFFFFLV